MNGWWNPIFLASHNLAALPSTFCTECFHTFGSQSELWSEARVCSRGNFLALSPTWVQSSLLVPAPGRRCTSTETIADAYQRRFGPDSCCNYWRIWLRRIDRTFSAGQWHPSSGGDAGCDSIWGSWAVTVGGEVPLNVLLTSHWINTKKTKKSQFRHLPVRSWTQKRQNTKNVSLAATHF